MAIIRAGNKADFTIKIGSLPENKLKVVQFQGEEGMSQLFHFNVDLASNDHEINFDDVVSQRALLTIMGPKEKRFVHGIVSLFELTGRKGDLALYRVEIVPSIWLLSHRHHCRIFQNKSVQEIIKGVLTDGGISSDDFKFSLKNNPKREYCVQYRETDLAFISRLMEEYGIFYFFEHKADQHVLIMGDEKSLNPPIPDPANVPYHLPDTTISSEEEEHIFEYRYHKQIRPAMVTLRDFNFEKPHLDLTVKSKGEGNEKLEIYDYPGEFISVNDGKQLAQIRMEEFQANTEVATGKSNCRRLIPGYRFTMDKHDRSSLNQEYLVTWVSHIGNQPQALSKNLITYETEPTDYRNQFRCIPSHISFRAPRSTPKPVIHSMQTAMVVGPSGETIHTDKFGRVKVKFHWDRESKGDDKSSCWLRVSQPWGGGNWGGMFIPHVGQEVIVCFEEGDADRPVITGRVYNADQMPPLELPANKTKSVIRDHGGNHIRLEGEAGKEQIHLYSPYAESKISIGAPNQGEGIFMKTLKNYLSDVKEDYKLLVEGDTYHFIKKDFLAEVEGNYKGFVGGKAEYKWKGAVQAKYDGINAVIHGGLVSDWFYGGKHSSFAGVSLQTNLSYQIERGKSGSNKVVAGKVKIDSEVETKVIGGGGKADYCQLKLDSNSVVLKCGKSEIIIDKDGDICINSKGNINIDAPDGEIALSSSSGKPIRFKTEKVEVTKGEFKHKYFEIEG